MVRFIAVVVLILAGVFGYETYVDKDYGVRGTVRLITEYGWAGGYGLVAGVAGSIGGIFGGR